MTKRTRQDFINEVEPEKTEAQKEGHILFYVSERKDGDYLLTLSPEQITYSETELKGPKPSREMFREVQLKELISEVKERRHNRDKLMPEREKAFRKFKKAQKDNLRDWLTIVNESTDRFPEHIPQWVIEAHDGGIRDFFQSPQYGDIITAADAWRSRNLIGTDARLQTESGEEIISVELNDTVDTLDMFTLSNEGLPVERQVEFKSLVVVKRESNRPYNIYKAIKNEDGFEIRYRYEGQDAIRLNLSDKPSMQIISTIVQAGTETYQWLKMVRHATTILNRWLEHRE